MSKVTEAFALSYQAARAKFLDAAAAAGLAVDSHLHPLKGLDGETLAMDVVRDGPADAERVLIVSSGVYVMAAGGPEAEPAAGVTAEPHP